MKQNIILTVTALFSIITTFGQRPNIELTFTAIDDSSYVQLDSIKVVNRTQGGDTVLYWPDTVLSIYYVGTYESLLVDNPFQVFQNYPNPVANQTTISLYVPEKDKVSIMVTDILGRMFVKSERVLDKGKHTFRFIPGNGNLYYFASTWQGQQSSIKILQNSFTSYNTVALEYIGYENSSMQLKASSDFHSFPFSLGDELLYIGYFDALQSGILDNPEESSTYTLQLATNIPCPGMPTLEYEGQVYNTMQIFSQCWLKENLNVGTMIQGNEGMTDNGIMEKYCYGNDTNNCNTYGGFYQWDEMMQYTTQQGAQGICPLGWHLPTDEEWKVLEGAVDSQYGIGDPKWDEGHEYRGYNAGKNLKTTGGWNENGNGTDLFGFSALPGGLRFEDSFFDGIGDYGLWWTSTEHEEYDYDAWWRSLAYDWLGINRTRWSKEIGKSVRCLRDY